MESPLTRRSGDNPMSLREKLHSSDRNLRAYAYLAVGAITLTVVGAVMVLFLHSNKWGLLVLGAAFLLYGVSLVFFSRSKRQQSNSASTRTEE
jgi:hypothetical protein